MIAGVVVSAFSIGMIALILAVIAVACTDYEAAVVWLFNVAIVLVVGSFAGAVWLAATAPAPACPERSTMVRRFTGYQPERVGKRSVNMPTYSITCEDPK